MAPGGPFQPQTFWGSVTPGKGICCLGVQVQLEKLGRHQLESKQPQSHCVLVATAQAKDMHEKRKEKEKWKEEEEEQTAHVLL